MTTAAPTVLILEAAAKASLPLIESSYRRGRRVVAASHLNVCTGMFSRYVSRRVRSPNAQEQPEDYKNWLLTFLASNKIDMLYPVGDVATDLVAQVQGQAREHARLVIPPYERFRVARDKILTMQAADRCGVPIPRTWYPDEDDLAGHEDQIVFPSLIKPALSAGARGIVFLDSFAQLQRELPRVRAEFGRCYVQEFVPGTQQKADAVIGPSGELLSGLVYDKLRYYPPAGGSSVLNRTVCRPDVIDSVAAMLSELGWFGFCDFDFITDERDGVARLIEINPRFPESFRATVAGGVDQAEQLWQLAHDVVPDPELDYQIDRVLRFLPGDVMWLLTTSKEERRRHLRSWLTFLSRDQLYQVCSARDPGPIVGYLLENLVRMADSDGRKERFRLQQARRDPA